MSRDKILGDVIGTLRMIENENLDIRTATLGVNLLGCRTPDPDETAERVYQKLMDIGRVYVESVSEIQSRFAVPIVNKRLSVTPVGLIAFSEPSDCVKIGHALDRAATDLGIDYIAGYSALVQKGMTDAASALIHSLPELLSTTEKVCCSVNLATTKSGINMDAVKLMGQMIRQVAEGTSDHGAIGCAKLVVFANAPDDNPFIAGAFHGPGEPEYALNVGVSGPGVVCSAIKRMLELNPSADLGEIAEAIKRMAFKITRSGEVIGRKVAQEIQNRGWDVKFGIIDLSLAPTPAQGDSVAEILETMGLEMAGTHGSIAALALLTDAVKKGGVMASSYVGGLSGAFIPVSEDAGMIRAVEQGAMSLERLEGMTAVCSVGLDMIAVPGDTPAATLSAIIADQMAIGVINNKTTAVRIIPPPGYDVGDKVEYGGLLGDAPVMKVNRFDSSGFINRAGRIPAPIQSMRN